MTVDPLVAECDYGDYGDYKGLTSHQIGRRVPGWDIWRDGCPHGESTADVGVRADAFLRTTVENRAEPVIVITHGHFSRILAARTLGLAPEYGRLYAERCLGLWNADATLLDQPAAQQPHRNANEPLATSLLPTGNPSS